MNRFVSAPSRHFISTQTAICVALLWQFTTLPASAQFQFPQSTAGQSTAGQSGAGESAAGRSLPVQHAASSLGAGNRSTGSYSTGSFSTAQPITNQPMGHSTALPSGTNQTRSSVNVDALLTQIGSAIERKDYFAAVQSFRQARAAGTKTKPQAARLLALRHRLATIGIDSALLNLPPKGPTRSIQRLPAVIGAKPIAATNRTNPSSINDANARNAASNNVAANEPGLSRKQQALRLVALGRVALDRGEISYALSLAKQAEALKVPTREFRPGEPQPWQLVLDAESAARTKGIALTGGQQGNSDGAVQPAIATSESVDRDVIQQMLFTADATDRPTGNEVQQVQAVAPLPNAQLPVEPPQPTYGQQMFNAGLEALTSGDKANALKQFKEAWKHQTELNPTQRNQLKDKLTLLQARSTGTRPTKPQGELTPIQKAELEKEKQMRRLYRQVTSELAKAEESKETKPLGSLDDLQRLSRLVDEAKIDDASKQSLSRMVDRAVSEQKKYVEANRAKIDLDLRNEQIRRSREADQLRDSQADEEVKTLVDDFNRLMKEKRFSEAEVIAKQVAVLRPDHPIAVQLEHNVRTKTNIETYKEIKRMKEDSFVQHMYDADRSMIAINPENPLEFDKKRDWAEISASRRGFRDKRDSHMSERERQIKDKLKMLVSIKYKNRPLSEVIEDLSAMTGVPIVIDERALSTVRVEAEEPISIRQLDNIRLESALNLILEQLELTYVIDNDVLEITSLESKQSRVYVQTYKVKDLVIPIPNFLSSYDDGLAGALRNAIQMTSPQQANVQFMPVSATDMGSRMGRSMSPSYMGGDMMGQFQSGGQSGFGVGGPTGAQGSGGGQFADFDSLMELIETTVAPETWEALGGPSTMQPYAQNLSLVISTTSEVHDQIVELLESLRRLQNLQITIEVRFITLADSFAEQIGVDFDVQFDDNVTVLPDDDSGPSVTIGFDGISGLPTADLDVRFENGSFGLAPPFGGGGLGTPSTIGFAILSDIEAFFFLQAAQADNRSNVMQAPKVTMFDGQFANISDITQRPFVTSITPVVGDFAVAQQPVIVVLNEGTQLNVQGIVSDDKRFVRLTLVPYFSQIGDVDTFTFEGERTTRSRSTATTDTDGDGDIDEDDIVETTEEDDVISGTTVQLPTFVSTSVQTTVSVPDGGTILLGGIKRLSEGRVERGVPVLSKIPYVSRLFRNVSAGRNAQSLMLMVTPRIIIQEEEELAQTGFDPNDP